MRVLYLTMNPNRESTTVPTEGWLRCLRGRGLEPVLVSHKAGAFHAWAMAEGIPAYEVPLPIPNKAKPWGFLWSMLRLWRLVRRHKIDLIHCNEQDIYPFGQYLARLSRLPVVVSVHFTMGRAYCNWAFGGKRVPRRIFFVSRANQEVCRPAIEGVIPESDWRLLPNGLDLERFHPDAALRQEFRGQLGLNSDPLIGVACALRPRKQLEHLFQAAEALSVPGLHVLLAGKAVPGDEAYAENLLQEAKQKLGDRLIYLGHLTDLRGFYNALDLFVNTSQEEACSISVIEALACGCPVLGYPSKSVDEQVLPDGGQIVAQDQTDGLTEALQDWLSDADKMSAGRDGARQRAEANYDIRKISDQLWHEYRGLAS